MEVTIKFDPTVDDFEEVESSSIAIVHAAYGTPKKRAQVSPPPAGMFNASEHQAADMACAVAQTPSNPLVSPAALGASLPAPAGATTASAPAAQPTSGGVQLDSLGVPWDARIHSSAMDEAGQRKKTAKGVWNKRKGVSDLEYTTVTNELLNMMAASVGTVATALPAGGVLGNPANVPHQVAVPIPGQPDAYEVQTAPQQFAPTFTARNDAGRTEGQLPPPMAAPMLVAPVAAPTPTDFAGLMQYLSANMQTEANPGAKLTQAHITHVCTHFSLVDGNGMASIGLAQSRPDLIAPLYQSFKNQIDAMV